MPRVSLAWFTILGAFGLWFPYYSLYLKENAGLSGTEVGLIMATPPLVGIVMQPLWAAVADRTGARTRLLALLALGAGLSILVLYRAHTFGAIAAATALYSCFNVGITPALWSVSFALLADRGARWLGYARVSGTLGYGVMVAAFPAILHGIGERQPGEAVMTGPRPGLELIFPLGAALLMIGFLIAWSLPRTGAVSLRAPRGELRHLGRNVAFLRLLLVTFVVFLFNQGPMALFPILVRAHGGGVEAVSWMWIVMLTLEVPLIATFGATERRLGIQRIIVIGVAAAAVRWLISGLSPNLACVTVAQALHGVTVWGLLLAAPAYADRVVPPSSRSTAQGLLSMIGMGMGGTLSSLASGMILDHYAATTLATVAGVLALALLLGLPWLLPPPAVPNSIGARSDTRLPDRS